MNDILTKQRQNIRRQLLSDLCSAAMLLIFALGVLFFALRMGDGQEQVRLLRIACPILVFFSLVYWVHALRDWRILQCLMQAQNNGLHTRQIVCKKVSFCLRRIRKHHHVVVGVTLRDENGEKFHFVFPIDEETPASTSTKLLKLTKQTVQLQCYHGSNALRSFQAPAIDCRICPEDGQ